MQARYRATTPLTSSSKRRRHSSDTPQAGAETAPDADRLVLVRDSKDPEGPVLSFTPSEWDFFLGMIKGGELADLG
ncbi:DUF397 domain-containing protein [Streptosporangium sp. NPDC002544]|uniref:DUF397 domain-containing protein n=1 Tax=unclassified Streptosporangium TaxID=2632669 RepID=UPI0033181C75